MDPPVHSMAIVLISGPCNYASREILPFHGLEHLLGILESLPGASHLKWINFWLVLRAWRALTVLWCSSCTIMRVWRDSSCWTHWALRTSRETRQCNCCRFLEILWIFRSISPIFICNFKSMQIIDLYNDFQESRILI